MKIKINEYKDIPICHISFDKALINYAEDTKDSYVSTLKNCTNVNINFMKSSIIHEIKDDEMSIASLAVSTLAAYNGIEFLRVHDIDENQDAVDVAWKTINS